MKRAAKRRQVPKGAMAHGICGKKAYAKKSHAEDALYRMKTERKVDRSNASDLNVYKCDLCAGHPFHIGRKRR